MGWLNNLPYVSPSSVSGWEGTVGLEAVTPPLPGPQCSCQPGSGGLCQVQLCCSNPLQQHSQEKCGLQALVPAMLECWVLAGRARAAKGPTELWCNALQGWPQLRRRFKKPGWDGLEARRGLWTLIELLQGYSGINEGKILILCVHSQKWMYAKPE